MRKAEHVRCCIQELPLKSSAYRSLNDSGMPESETYFLASRQNASDFLDARLLLLRKEATFSRRSPRKSVARYAN